VTRGEPDAVKAARPVREGGPGKRTRRNPGTAPGADPHWEIGGETKLSNCVMLCKSCHVRHEALFVRMGVKDPRLRPIAVGR
jgi:hypothetical protein